MKNLTKNEVILKLMKLIREKYKSINELEGRIDGVGTVIKFLLERININTVESRIMTASNGFNSFENALGQIIHRLDMLESKLMQVYSNKKWSVNMTAINMQFALKEYYIHIYIYREREKLSKT